MDRSLHIEPLEHRYLLTLDFGDAPQFYPTVLAEDGARHEAVGPTLGAGRDSESDGTHSAGADYDGADEDGVIFGLARVGQLGATVTVNVQGGPAKLDAWIDFNGDGSWGGPGEQIADSLPMAVGDNGLTFDMPSWAVSGTTFARFRLSTAGDLGVGGLAADGEVEDYALSILPPILASNIFSGRSVISDSLDEASSIVAADMDGDGDMDVVSASRDDSTIAWHENDGVASFTPHILSTAALEAQSVSAVDLDGDGDTDVLSNSANTIAWYENDGAQNFTSHTLATLSYGATCVRAADLDGDGDLDVLAAELEKFTWYENDGLLGFAPHLIENGLAAFPSQVETADIDRDGDLDILGVASFIGGDGIWFENDGAQQFAPHHSIFGDAISLFAADMDRDGDTDVVAVQSDGWTLWFDNLGSGNFTYHVINSTNSAERGVAADVDGDGDMDVVIARSSTITLCENDGNQSFVAHNITTTAHGLQDATIADVDGNGILDVISASGGDDPIAWFENLGWDFGDAPSPYPVEEADQGAHHLATGPTLGSARDIESDGLHSAGADGDGADEDGVTFGLARVGQLGATVTVNVQGGPAKLDAWIDFNGDGSWGGPGEQIADSLPMAVGDNGLTFDIPSWTVSGATFARFRLSTAGDLGVGGLAADGEVEDYALSILPPIESAGVLPPATLVTAALTFVNGITTADVDGDGDLDAITASDSTYAVSWHENDGAGNFIAQHPVSNIGGGADGVVATDVDGDGDMDIVAARRTAAQVVWYENDGSQTFITHVIATSLPGVESVIAADLDTDGDVDVLSASIGKVAWFENDGTQSFASHTISSSANFNSVNVADVDADGDLDVLSASSNAHRVDWYENDGNQTFVAHAVIMNGSISPNSAFPADIDRDGDTDILTGQSNTNGVRWYENDGSQSFTERVISTTVPQTGRALAVDLDGDSHLDIVTTGTGGASYYRNDGTENFSEHKLNDHTFLIAVGDVSGDGRIDLLSGAGSYVVWYEGALADFGDAPTPYQTTSSEGGPVHQAIGPTLGSSRDGETDGTHSVNADSDGADDDGVTFGTIRVGALDAEMIVNVQGTIALLDAWIDFNHDGSWGGPGEQIADSVFMSVGDNTLAFDVPSWATDGVTFARFRLSTAGNLGIGGTAIDGEVEDYAVTIVPPAVAAAEFAAPRVVSSGADAARSVFAADIDGDGDMDLVTASQLDNTVAWHENDGLGGFVAHPVTATAYGAISVFAADVDGDGDLDILSASGNDDTVAWYQNDGSQNFIAHTVTTGADGVNCVFAADLDNDGDLDVISSSFSDNWIRMYENDGFQNFTAFGVTGAAFGAQCVSAADMDGDGDMDILSASFLDNMIAWYENRGGHWYVGNVLSTSVAGAYSVVAADVDGDGDMDVLAAARETDRIYWYENDGDQNFSEQLLAGSADGIRGVSAADLDGDGDVDVLSASLYDDKIAWYKNDGSGQFSAHTIATSADGAVSAIAADIDGDGDLDVVSTSLFDDTVAWYDNASWDFGDAPQPYPTVRSYFADGARHNAKGPTLGASRDAEGDGTYSANADADGADEDGITFGLVRVGQLAATVTVNVHGGLGKLDAWIDFNADGSWGNADEQIADGLALQLGDNVVSFDVPSWAADGVTFARFRLSTAGNLGVGGPAADGEVEDYAVTVLPPALADGFYSGRRVVSNSADGANDAIAADVDSDGDMDLVSTSTLDNKIAWYENDGNQVFTTHTISSTAISPTSVFATDVDGDGDLDLLSTSFDNKIAWYENDGNQMFTEHVVTANESQPNRVSAADLDGDGDTDLLSASAYGLVWYENDGTQNFASHIINASGKKWRSVAAVDVDSDGDLDVLAASSAGPYWFEQLGIGTPSFSSHSLVSGSLPPFDIYQDVAGSDLDSDGDTDIVVSWAAFGSAWLENDGSENFEVHYLGSVGRLYLADVDGDGDTDIVTAGGVVGCQVNVGGGEFTYRTINTASITPTSVFAADMDHDGDIDVISTSSADDTVAWYENQPDTVPVLVTSTSLFYRGSTKWNVTNNNLPGFSDDNAIAPDKTAYLPGNGNAAFSAVSSYTRGINGIMVDITGPHGTITANDFNFKVGNNNSPSLWTSAPAPIIVTTRVGAGVSGDRIELMWGDNAIQKTWLEVVVEGNDALGGFNTNTGLTSSYVFYFGNALGDSGAADTSTFLVSSADEQAARNDPHGPGNPATISSTQDFNRDGLVNSTDQQAARNNATNPANALKFLNVGAGGPFAPATEGDGSGSAAPAVAVGGDSGISSGLAASSFSSISSIAVAVPVWITERLAPVVAAPCSPSAAVDAVLSDDDDTNGENDSLADLASTLLEL